MRRICLLLVALSLLSASTPALAARPSGAPRASGPAPKPLEVTGRVLTAAGRVPGTPLAVRVTERQGGFDIVASLFVMALGGPAGLVACLTRTGICTEAGATTVRVRADGRFAVPVPSGVGDYDVSVLSLTGATPTYYLSATLDVPAEGVRLPDLRLWEATPRVSTPEGAVRFEWDPLPESYANGVKYDVSLTPARRSAPYGFAKVTANTAVVDARELEDAPGRAKAVATARLGAVEVRWLSRTVRYPAPAGRPLSRGRGCRIVVQDGAVNAFAPCWLGNGRFDDLFGGYRRGACYRTVVPGDEPEYHCGKRPVVAVRLDLGAVREVGEIRNVACSRCTIDVSADGVTWSTPERIETLRREPVVLGAGTRARYVRVQAVRPVVPVAERERTPTAPVAGDLAVGLAPNDLALMTELSVWGPRPVPTEPAGGPRETGRARAGRPDAGAGAGGGGSSLVLAGLAALVAVGALAYAAGRHAPRRTGSAPPPPW